MRSVDCDYIAQDGEIVFTDYATEEQLKNSFPNLTIIKQQQTIQQLTSERETKLSQLLLAAEKAKILGNSTATIEQKYQSILSEYKTKIVAIANETI